jgi:hypothetical protein
MARTKRIIRRSRNSCVCEEEVTEVFTHVCRLDDGTFLRGDPAENFWLGTWGSWYGTPPEGWDAAKAVEEVFRRSYEEEADYS